MEKLKIIAHRYTIISVLGEGGFGRVFKVYDGHKKHEFALKMDLSSNGSCLAEAKVLRDLEGGEGIPKVHDSGKENSLTFMVLDLLGTNLSKLRRELKDFSLNTVTLILLQSLNRIEYVHLQGYLHRDVKPQQFLLGPNNIIYLVDYSISKKYIIDGNHISYQTQCMRAGSCNYASLNSHMGIRLSRRDDLESLMYMCVFLLKGVLPWQNSQKFVGVRKWQETFSKKRDIRSELLFQGCPFQFQAMHMYIKNLKFNETPNYQYLKDLIHEIRSQNCLRVINFDWVMVEKNESRRNKKSTLASCTGKKGKKKSNKVKHRSRHGQVSKTVSNVNAFPHNYDILSIILDTPQNCKTLTDSFSGVTSKFDLNGDETIKNYFPEFINRKRIFRKLKKFLTNF